MELYLRELEKLNEYQKKAVTSMDKYMLLNAAVGSGKTTVLVHKVLYLHFIKNVPLEEMVVLTFTKKATEEMKNRIAAFGDNLVGSMRLFGTFHSVARQILSESEILDTLGYKSNFEIIDNDEASTLLFNIMETSKLQIKYKSKLLKRIEEFKNGKSLYGVMKKSDDIEELISLYREEKIKRNIMDFDDIIENSINVLKEPLNPQWIIVDEFQDTDYRQLALIKNIAGKDTNIFCIGDPNQIIYSWRSGTENIFKEFRELYKPLEMGLPLNYRSTRTIIEAANAFLYGTSIEGTKDYGSKIKISKHHDAFNEAIYVADRIKKLNSEGIPYKHIGILYRRQLQLEALLNVLIKEGIPCNILFKKALPFEDLDISLEDENGVNLLTLHASKGLEFSHVFIIGANMGNIPLTSKKSEEPEELRLFYVGITRAKTHLEISYLAKPGIQGATSYKSPYISMIPRELLLIEEEENRSKNSISNLMDMLREERAKKDDQKQAKAKHSKYGIGNVVYEDDEIIKVDFEVYGIKEFSKMFCPLEII